MSGMTAAARVFVIAGDPGGASALAGVIEWLRQEGQAEVAAFAYRQAASIWKSRGLAFDLVPDDIFRQQSKDLLAASRAALLLLGTSVNGLDLEKLFLESAGELGIRSLAVLDYWSNYRFRFAQKDGELLLPDKIAVMDARACREMVAEGFPEERLVVTGQPAFDRLRALRDAFSDAGEIRRRVGAAPDAKLVVFASQPIGEVYGRDETAPGWLGYVESDVLDLLVASLDRIAEHQNVPIVLVIRPHPREDAAKFSSVRARRIRIVLEQDVDAYQLAMASDLLVGMNSILLLEACYLGVIALSLQPGLVKADCLPTKSVGQTQAVYRRNEAETAIESLLFDEERRQRQRAELLGFAVDGLASRRVAELIYGMLQSTK
ncbi:MAG: hypothetical protein HY850_08595 [Betaproteobacteria bacterium]|nr:hypothetical protein [Betaproteobacteria bacterium]